MQFSLWVRWLAMRGALRAGFAVQARLGDPLARLLVTPELSDDPHPVLEQIRTRGPLVHTPVAWVTTDHAVCRNILRDKRFGVMPMDMGLPQPVGALIKRTDPGVANPVEPPAMLMVDPPDHTRYRQLVAQSFTPRAIGSLNTRVAEITAELVDRLAVNPNPDLITDFAAPLATEVISDMLGFPPGSTSKLANFGRSGSTLLDVGIKWKTYQRAIDDLRIVSSFLDEHLGNVRAHGSGDNPFSRLAADGALTDHEYTANAAMLIGAGVDTTVNLIGNGIVLLLQHRDQLDRLREDPTLWDDAIEEILRFDSPVQMLARVTNCELELAGHHVPSGEFIALMIGGANRDPVVFTEPSRFDITRSNARDHLAFSSGVHSCLGAPLARAEGVIALRALFETFPDICLAGPPKRRGLVTVHGFKELPVRLGRRRPVAATRNDGVPAAE
ncbi:cytochrome P450 [Nocardia sp. NPDC020380]|uniref:cytochrome P450 n=1 Tax=Nocardia sp. NPDC020380 TaxID=3364309 RepID=UPI0037B85719